MKYNSPSNEEANNYIRIAKKWVDQHPESHILKNVKTLSYISVSEFLANSNEHSLLIIKRNKGNKMSDLLKKMKFDMNLAMKNEITLRKKGIYKGDEIDEAIAVKEVVRSIISMFPEINIKPNNSTDNDVIKLLKKYVQSEKIRELYNSHILSGSKVTGLSSKELNKLQQEKINELGEDLTNPKIKVALHYLPKEPSREEIVEWILENIDFSQYKSKIQAMGLIMKQFNGVDGDKIKQILMGM